MSSILLLITYNYLSICLKSASLAVLAVANPL